LELTEGPIYERGVKKVLQEGRAPSEKNPPEKFLLGTEGGIRGQKRRANREGKTRVSMLWVVW